MNVHVNVKHGIDEILDEMGRGRSEGPADILTVKAKDKLFIGGGCESPFGFDGSEVKNLSICRDSQGL